MRFPRVKGRLRKRPKMRMSDLADHSLRKYSSRTEVQVCTIWLSSIPVLLCVVDQYAMQESSYLSHPAVITSSQSYMSAR